MSYIDQTLSANELVFYRCRPHWIIFFKPFFSLLAGLLIFYWDLHLIGIILLVMALIGWISAVIVYFTSEFGITSRRVVIKLGFIRRYSFENLLTRIEGIEVNQSILGRLLNYGSLCIRGVGGSGELFPAVPDPLLFRQKVQEQLNL
ncbi:MAG: PH domain-containing protein [Rickettsiella sp.]|nr:PH domain-containing protein [Rickettsiella sp.]